MITIIIIRYVYVRVLFIKSLRFVHIYIQRDIYMKINKVERWGSHKAMLGKSRDETAKRNESKRES